MKRCFGRILLLLLIMAPLAADDALSRAFREAQDMVRNSKPSSERGSRERDDRASSSETRAERVERDDGERDRRRAVREAERQADADERERLRKAREDAERAREEEQTRIAKNLRLIEAKLAAARGTPRLGPPNPPQASYDAAAVMAKMQQLQNALSSTPEGRAARQLALKGATVTKAATAQRTKPAFQPLWNAYVYNRPIGYGLVPNENKCAIVMSMTLGFQPGADEHSLHEIGNRTLADKVKHAIKTRELELDSVRPEFVKTEAAGRYYIKAQELAERLIKEWNEPQFLNGPEARAAIAGKRGVVFLQDAYGVTSARSGDHIDLWDGDHIATSATMPFAKAKQVWFWELP